MKVLKVIVTTTEAGVDLVSNIMFEAGSPATTIMDNQNITHIAREVAKVSDETKTMLETAESKVLVMGAFEDAKALSNIKVGLKKLATNSNLNLGELSIAETYGEEPEWLHVWQNFYPPKIVGKFKIFPEWHKNKKCLFKTPIVMEVGDAFGTGHHPTTEMCLEFMQKLDMTGKRVFDIGAGTGILAICAIKLGASEKDVIATDIWDVALNSCKKNARLNDVKLNVKNISLLDGINSKADIILANLSSDLLVQLSKKASKNLVSKGLLIASGITEDRLLEIIDCFAKTGIKLKNQKSKDGWFTLLLQKE